MYLNFLLSITRVKLYLMGAIVKLNTHKMIGSQRKLFSKTQQMRSSAQSRLGHLCGVLSAISGMPHSSLWVSWVAQAWLARIYSLPLRVIP